MINDTLLRLYVSNNLDRETAAQVEQELQRNPDLRRRLEEMQQGEPSFSNQEIERGAPAGQSDSEASAHLGATEDQMQPNVEPVARNPVPESNADQSGIDPQDEITPG